MPLKQKKLRLRGKIKKTLRSKLKPIQNPRTKKVVASRKHIFGGSNDACGGLRILRVLFGLFANGERMCGADKLEKTGRSWSRPADYFCARLGKRCNALCYVLAVLFLLFSFFLGDCLLSSTIKKAFFFLLFAPAFSSFWFSFFLAGVCHSQSRLLASGWNIHSLAVRCFAARSLIPPLLLSLLFLLVVRHSLIHSAKPESGSLLILRCWLLRRHFWSLNFFSSATKKAYVCFVFFSFYEILSMHRRF